MIRGDLNVRALAEFTGRMGDLYPPRRGRPIEPEEGIAKQKAVQQQRLGAHPDYRREVLLSTVFSCGGEQHTLQGRADGILQREGSTIIEEFKCCSVLPEQADPVDFTQALIYAGLFAAIEDTGGDIEVRLVYLHADELSERHFDRKLSAAAARKELETMLLAYVTRVERHLQRVTKRMDWAARLNFPMPRYRPSQKAIARRVYRALKDGENLLIEAPTGSGKSLAILYPVIKALEVHQQAFFLTSRNPGARAATSAIGQLDPAAKHISMLEITAKEKICPVPGMPCDAAQCTYAAGYFERAPEAVDELLERKFADRASVEEVAEQYRVCPFEMTLDTAPWADVVIGDYNYIFDPVIRLQRFQGDSGLQLLVDEAHQLNPRSRDMLTVSLDRSLLAAAGKTTHQLMQKRVASIDRALLGLRKIHGPGTHAGVLPTSVERACARFLEVAAEVELELKQHPELSELYFAVIRWQRSDGWYNPAEFEHILAVTGREVALSRICLDPGSYLRQVYASHGSVIRFSATVSPLALYQRLHGLQETGEANSERAGSPFTEDQAMVLLVSDIPTYFKQRDASMPRLAKVLTDLMKAESGRYLVALPSYEFLQGLSGCADAAWGAVFVQQRGQRIEQSEMILADFAKSEHGVLFIVMGGVYGESVDFAGFSLKGVVIVGLGLPPPSLERKLLQDHFDAQEGAGWGRMVAYTQPALVKNIQAAGRLIRSEEDFGVLCLVDPRFTAAEVQRFFPGHWRPQITGAAQVFEKVSRFWQQQKEINDSP